jgi:hypothetical protein
VQRAALHEHGGQRALARVEGGLEHRAAGFGGCVRLEVEDFRLEQDLIEELLDAGAFLGRDLGAQDLAAENSSWTGSMLRS